MEWYVGIPTLTAEHLDRCLGHVFGGSAKPEGIFVVNNGRNPYRHTHKKVQVIHAPHNLGTSRSWNLIHDIVHPSPLLLLNDDVFLDEYAAEKALALKGLAVFIAGFSAFMLAEEVWEKVGRFDEAFWPAYFEDNDYAYRLKIAGIPEMHLKTDTGHVGSASLGGPDKEAIKARYEQNRMYYAMKWGGEPGFEKYQRPFNGRYLDRSYPKYDF
jgi:GT2 family glycosyltransferase